jgi:predicted dehydrogenase
MKTRSLLSRRQFLQTTALAAPAILSSGLWPARGSVPASERLTLGMIGTGKIAQSHLGGFLGKKETQIVAVCDVDTTRRLDAARRVNEHYAKQSGRGSYNGCAVYSDYRQLLDRRDLDAVVICTPDHWHTIQSIAACNAKLDVYCEKPLTLTLREGRELAKTVRRTGRVFQTGSQQRSSKEFRTACELVRNGVLGRITQIDAAVGESSKWCDLPEEPMEPGLNWDLWLGPAPMRSYNSILSPRGVHDHFPKWREYREYSGGYLTDWGAHHFDIVQWALGMDESGPIEIIPPSDPKATHGCRFKYGTGVEMIHASGNGITFHGSVKGVQKASTPKDCDAVVQEFLPPGSIRLYASNDHRGDWLECIRTRERPICDVEVGHRSISVAHLANLAYWNRRNLYWDPQKEEFMADREANTWRDRERRGPWKV